MCRHGAVLKPDIRRQVRVDAEDRWHEHERGNGYIRARLRLLTTSAY